jgi:amino acid transporter
MQYDKHNIIALFSLLLIIIITLRWIYQYVKILTTIPFQSFALILSISMIGIIGFKFLNRDKLHDYAKKHGLIIKRYNRNQYAISINRLDTSNNIQFTDENILQLSAQLLTTQLIFSLLVVPKNDNNEIYLIIFKLINNRSDIDNFIDQLFAIKASFHAYLGYTVINEIERLMKNELPIPI